MRDSSTATSPTSVMLNHLSSYSEWRRKCRWLLSRQVAPEHVAFSTPQTNGDLFAAVDKHACEPKNRSCEPGANIRVPKAFPNLARQVLCHNDDSRFSLLYRLLWRVQTDRTLLMNESDRDVWSAHKMAQAVRRDSHKMKAFVRFRKIESNHHTNDNDTFVAWFEPEHHVVKLTAPFFAKRFAGMRWSIVTPLISAHWNGITLNYGDGAYRSDCPNDDALEEHWRVYYSSIFNPARLKIKAMMTEMPVKYWRNLPESRLIPELTRSATQAQRAAPSGKAPSLTKARQLVAAQPGMRVQDQDQHHPTSIDGIRQALQQCSRCSLCHHATSAVAGEGPESAKLMLVGEQPGDAEDLAGRPFLGPAGDVLNRALTDAGIRRKDTFVTNAVKHFKYSVRGKRRLHMRPDTVEIEQCRWWLNMELKVVAPRVVVALGQTAMKGLVGHSARLADRRGEPYRLDDDKTLVVTTHPAYLLRMKNRAEQQRHYARFVQDLTLANALTLN